MSTANFGDIFVLQKNILSILSEFSFEFSSWTLAKSAKITSLDLGSCHLNFEISENPKLLPLAPAGIFLRVTLFDMVLTYLPEECTDSINKMRIRWRCFGWLQTWINRLSTCCSIPHISLQKMMNIVKQNKPLWNFSLHSHRSTKLLPSVSVLHSTLFDAKTNFTRLFPTPSYKLFIKQHLPAALGGLKQLQWFGQALRLLLKKMLMAKLKGPNLSVSFADGGNPR